MVSWRYCRRYILLFVAIVVIVARFHWYVYGRRIKSNLLRYSVFSILSSGILAILQTNTYYDFFDEGISKNDWINLSAFFTAYMIIAIFYPILKYTIDKHSEN